MKEYIFYTMEGLALAPDGESIENGQLLGCAYGTDKHDAIKNLLKENAWIKERGFNPCEAICRELAPTSSAEDKMSFLTDLLDESQFIEYKNWLKSIE